MQKSPTQYLGRPTELASQCRGVAARFQDLLRRTGRSVTLAAFEVKTRCVETNFTNQEKTPATLQHPIVVHSKPSKTSSQAYLKPYGHRSLLDSNIVEFERVGVVR